MIKLCDLTPPNGVYKAVEDVLKSQRYVKGPLVEEFSQKWADRCGMKYGIGVSSGAMALELVTQVLGPISTFPWTYKAVWNALDRIQGYHEFDPLEPDIYAHHCHDQAPKYKPMIEDCSHCHGYKPVAETAIFSFFPTKILGGIGDAGIIVTNSDFVYNESMRIRDHGEPKGTNGRCDEIQAAALLAKLPYLDGWIKKRQEIVNIYDAEFGIKTKGKYHYIYTIKGSEEKRNKLINMGIESKFYYTPEYMAIPLHPFLTDNEIKKVIISVKQL